MIIRARHTSSLQTEMRAIFRALKHPNEHAPQLRRRANLIRAELQTRQRTIS